MVSTSRSDLPSFAAVLALDVPMKLQPLLSWVPTPPQCGHSALVLGKNPSLTPASSLQSLHQEEGPSSTSVSCQDFLSDIPSLMWPHQVNTEGRAAATPVIVVTLVVPVDGVSSSHLVSPSRKPGVNPTKISSNWCQVCQQAASTAGKAVTFAGGFGQLGGF